MENNKILFSQTLTAIYVLLLLILYICPTLYDKWLKYNYVLNTYTTVLFNYITLLHYSCMFSSTDEFSWMFNCKSTIIYLYKILVVFNHQYIPISDANTVYQKSRPSEDDSNLYGNKFIKTAFYIIRTSV